jgi:hypothetical protein
VLLLLIRNLATDNKCGRAPSSYGYDCGLSSRCVREQLKDVRHQWLQVSERIAVGDQHDDRDIERREALLVLEFPIDSQKHIEFADRET